MPLFETITDLAEGAERLRCRRYGVIEVADGRFRDTRQAADAYAEAWGLVYFLLHQHPKECIAYLKLLAAKQPLFQDGPERRLEEFEKFFGPWKRLDGEFLRFITRVR